MRYEIVEQIIVAPANASAQPLAVVVKFLDTVVAEVAVRRAWGSEDEATIAEFELEEEG